jgi:hypothetical protein
VLVELLDLTFATGVRGWVGSECQIRSTRKPEQRRGAP